MLSSRFSLTILLATALSLPLVNSEETKPAEKTSGAAQPAPSVTVIPGTEAAPATSFIPVTRKILALLKEAPAGEMKPYTETVPRAENATFDLVPIPGGQLTLGSPDAEEGRRADEGPLRTIKINPFWMATTETTWGLYRIYMENGKSRNKDGSLNQDGDIMTPEPSFAGTTDLVDAISQPTPPYMPMHFGLGDDAGYDAGYPAISMTQHAASKFCEWLTAQTGHYYRLPTEAEWEYACRAGTTTAYSFGNDTSKLDDFAWYVDNSDFTYHPVGKKKPNPWGLFDMHGNVREWTLDAYLPDYQKHPDKALNPLALSTERYPRVSRGGDWDADPEDLRSAARLPSSKSWKFTDPQRPRSIWYHTDIPKLGFRVIRPAKTPGLEEMHLLWNVGPGTRND
ncbi:formylglycine-generating enzyme family protein [Verrucomicrobiaceae bacterium 227]